MSNSEREGEGDIMQWKQFVKLDISVISAGRHCHVFTISAHGKTGHLCHQRRKTLPCYCAHHLCWCRLSKGGEQGEGCSGWNPDTRKGSEGCCCNINHLMGGFSLKKAESVRGWQWRGCLRARVFEGTLERTRWERTCLKLMVSNVSAKARKSSALIFVNVARKK